MLIDFTDDEIERIRVFRDTYNALYLSDFNQEKLTYLKSNSNSIQVRSGGGGFGGGDFGGGGGDF